MHVSRWWRTQLAVGALFLGACGSGAAGTSDPDGDPDGLVAADAVLDSRSESSADASDVVGLDATEAGADQVASDGGETPGDVAGEAAADVPDEVDVADPPNCPHEYVDGCFVCNDGQLISVNWVCNGGADCFDGSDEYPMNEACGNPTFACLDGTSVQSFQACNQSKDCPDASDEYPLNQACDPLFWCADDFFLWSVADACDGVLDCLDRSDEGPANAACPPTFTCADGTPLYSFEPACNQSPQCSDGSDEFPANPNCPTPGSCVGSCGGPQGSGCWCDALCAVWGDCCPDRCDACADVCEPPPTALCVGKPLPVGMTCIPGGTYTDTHWTGPNVEHAIYNFAMDTTEVTAAAYHRCVGAGVCSNPDDWAFTMPNSPDDGTGDHPINWATFLDARTYCEWAGKRLPTEWEWEWAARGRYAATTFPWGNAEIDASDLCMWPTTLSTCPVGSYSPASDSPEGVQDLTSNVQEWVWSETNGVESASVRGGSYQSVDQTPGMWIFVPSTRVWYAREPMIGFRCVKTL